MALAWSYLSRQERVGHFPAQAGGKRDQALAVFCEQFVIDARLVVKAVEVAGGNELDQILVAFFVFAKQDEMIRALGIGAAVLVIVRRDVHFAADDRLHAVRGGLMIEIRGGEKIAVVGDGDGGHAPARGFRRQFADFAGSVQERVVRVQMQMNEVRGQPSKFYFKPASRFALTPMPRPKNQLKIFHGRARVRLLLRDFFAGYLPAAFFGVACVAVVFGFVVFGLRARRRSQRPLIVRASRLAAG